MATHFALRPLFTRWRGACWSPRTERTMLVPGLPTMLRIRCTCAPESGWFSGLSRLAPPLRVLPASQAVFNPTGGPAEDLCVFDATNPPSNLHDGEPGADPLRI